MLSRGEMTDAAMPARAECVMLNKGPFLLDATSPNWICFLGRVGEHMHKKTPQLAAWLASWYKRGHRYWIIEASFGVTRLRRLHRPAIAAWAPTHTPTVAKSLVPLSMPHLHDYAVTVLKPGSVEAESTRILRENSCADVMKLNLDKRNFRLFGFDETASNRLGRRL